MGLIQLHAPQNEPVSVEYIKTYLHIDHNHEDDLIAHLIQTARQAIESYTVRSLLRQAWRFTFNAGFGTALSNAEYLPGRKGQGEHGIELPRSPFISLIDKPKLVDAYGSHDIQDYRLDMTERIARLYFTSSLTSTLQARGCIQVDFWAGYGQTIEEIPNPLRHAMLMMVGQLYAYQASANDNSMTLLPLEPAIIQLIKPYKIVRL